VTRNENSGWRVASVVPAGVFDTDGRSCTAEEAERVRTVLEVFPELIGTRTIPDIAERLKSCGVLELFPPANERKVRP
jgi:hypothetical protein